MPASAKRLADIEPFRVMDILARAKAMQAAGRDIIHMEVGEPDFNTPDPIINAGIAALKDGLTHYTPSLGLPALRQAIALDYARRWDITVAPERVAVTPGASGALMLALSATLNPGDELLLADPGYPCNRHFARLLEVEARSIPVGADSAFQLNAALIDANWTSRTRAVLLANPGNPTGTRIPFDELRAIREVVRARGGWLIVDEIYHELMYGHDDPSALALSEDGLIVINSFSKYYQMTGWRLGWLVAPTSLVDGIDRLSQNLYLAAPTLAQYAALQAFTPETLIELESRKAELQARRDYLVPELQRLGFSIPVLPEGAFYVYAGIEAFSDDADDFARRLLDEVGVAVTPGTDFGQHQAPRHVRFAYTTTLPRIQEACQRLARFVGRDG